MRTTWKCPDCGAPSATPTTRCAPPTTLLPPPQERPTAATPEPRPLDAARVATPGGVGPSLLAQSAHEVEYLHRSVWAAREAHGLTFRAAAAQIGIGVGSLQHIEADMDVRRSVIVRALRWLADVEEHSCPVCSKCHTRPQAHQVSVSSLLDEPKRLQGGMLGTMRDPYDKRGEAP